MLCFQVHLRRSCSWGSDKRDELAEYMTEYDRDWYLGTETDHDLQLSIMDEKPFLFLLGSDKGKVGCYYL